MILHPDSDPLDADWTKHGRFDLPYLDAASLARWLHDTGQTYEAFARLPAFPSWLAVIPWMADVKAAYDALIKHDRAVAASLRH